MINHTGVGSKGAASPLHVKAASDANCVTLKCRDADDFAYITFTDSDASEALAEMYVRRTGAATGSLVFGTNAGGNFPAERMRIESDGDIRLGSSSNFAWIRPYESSTGNLLIASNKGATGGANDSAIVFQPRGSERMRLTSNTDGQLLIGTTSGSNSSGTGVKLRGGGAATVDVVTNAATNINLHHVYNIHSNNNGYRYYLSIDGGIRNWSNNNVNLSDEREKKKHC